ncbi:MAG: hypothetical protein QXN40_07975, partial [Candidatus Bathyarchaeia archaeon]
EIVGCKPVDFIKTLVIITLASWLASFVFANVFWSIAPIPSSAYPYTVTGWPVEIVDRNRWIRWLWTGILFKPDFILLGFILGSAVCIASNLMKVAYIPVAMVMGVFTGMPTILSQFIGCIIGNMTLFKFKNLIRYRSQIVIGFMMGDSIVACIVSSIMLAIKSQWLLPY